MSAAGVRHAAPPLPGWLEAMLPRGTERFAVETREGYRVHVMQVVAPQAPPGVPQRTVLLQHGNPTWGFLYRRVVEALRGLPVRCVMPDLVGLGFSDRPRAPAEHTLANHARWVGEVIDALELDDLVFVGQDWGGPIGLRALAERPGRMSALVVLNTVLGPPKPGFRPTLFHRLSQLPLVSDALFRGLSFPQSVLGMAQGDRASIRGAVARAYREPLRGLRGNHAPLMLARMVPDRLAHPSVSELERVQAFVEAFEGPSAIVWGKRDPILGRVLRRTARQLPRAAVTETQAGHFLQEEVPGPIAHAIARVAGLS